MEYTKPKAIPLPSVKRLPLYRRVLQGFDSGGRKLVSCTHIAQELGLDEVQVRKDLAITGIVGKPKVGYEVPELLKAVDEFLGWDYLHDAFVVGAGSLGSAFLGHEGFREYGLNIRAAFDVDPAKVGTQVHGKEIFSLEKLPDLVSRMRVLIALLTVPASAAQQAANEISQAGIQAILNFTSVRLNVPDEVIVEDVNLAASLAALSSRLGASLKKQTGSEPAPIGKEPAK